MIFCKNSSLDSTEINSTLDGGEIFVGPLIKIVFAPKNDKVSAISYPCSPEEKFPMNLIGSIFSIDGPAVTIALIPLSFFLQKKGLNYLQSNLHP